MVVFHESWVFLVICFASLTTLANSYVDTICIPGKITGQPCPTIEEILSQSQPLVDNVKENLRTKSKEYLDRINSLRGILNKHNLDTRNDMRLRINEFKVLINTAKQETVTSSAAVQACVRRKELDLNKIQARNLLACSFSGNLASLSNIRMQILKLEQSIAGSVFNCKRLNPLQSQVYNLKNCILSRVKDVNKQIQMMDREFERVSRSTMKNSLACNMKISEEVFEDISHIFGALKDCRYATL